MIAHLFPGQGSEGPDMAGDALSRPGPVRELVDRASRALELDLEALLARADPQLARTEVGQPALIAISLGLALETKETPAATAGHSVGELAAFSLAGCISPEDAIDCVVARSRFMAEAARKFPGTMAAVRARNAEEVEQALAIGSEAGQVELAAHNAPEEWVLTGDRAALAAITSRFATVQLPVTGPWHSRAMSDAATQWRLCLERLTWKPPRIPVVANSTGRFIREGDDLIQLLVGQLTQPVRWATSLQTLAAAGITTWKIFGPGRVLRGLCRANLGNTVHVELNP